VFTIANARLGQFHGKGGPIAGPQPEPPVASPRKKSLRREKEQAHLVIGFLGTTVTSRDRHAMEVLNTILAGQGGRLFLELRDKQHLAYSVTSFNVEGIEPGAFGVYIGTSHKTVDEAREGIWRVIRELRDEPVGLEELEQTKRHLVGGAEIDLAHLSITAQAMALDELLGLTYKNPFRVAEHVNAVTAEMVQSAARRYLNPDAFVEALITN
jgi:zinc protease